MTKKELAKAVAEKTGVTIKDAEAVLDAAMDVTTETLKSGDKIQLLGFATLSPVVKPERTFRNPQTGETAIKPESKAVKVKFGKKVIDALNG